MEYITTFTGEDITPLTPEENKIHIEDIAHALSLMCRANGHFVHFFSVAQHSINCAKEARARVLSENIQLACLLHNGSEAYLSDITRTVKKHLSRYIEIEKHLQDIIFKKFLENSLSSEEIALVKNVDDDILIHEFNDLMNKKVYNHLPPIHSNPSFDFAGFLEIENHFISLYSEISKQPVLKNQSINKQIAEIEKSFQNKSKNEILEYLKQNNIPALFSEKLLLKSLSTQIDLAIHAYGILLALPQILDNNEKIEYLSLGAGNTGKPFDISTSKRIAEFKFSKWSKSRNAIRQNNIFKDFLELALDNNGGKKKYIYCYSAVATIKFLSGSKRTLKSVLSRNSINKKYPEYQQKYKTVKDFYHDFKDEVEIVDLENILGNVE